MRPSIWLQMAAFAMATSALSSAVAQERPAMGPVWLTQPTIADFAAIYPPEALAAGISGEATLDCLVDGAGLLTCTVTRETPPGAGFGEAAIRASRLFRMAPEGRDGRPTAGGRLVRVIRFSPD